MHAVHSPIRAPPRRTHRLNIFGLDVLDPIALAALADGRPLLPSLGHSADWISRVSRT